MVKCLVAVMVLWAGAVVAAPYDVDSKASSVDFSGTHAGTVFNGEFQDWLAEIDFEPENLAASMVSATFNLNSARTGNAMFDMSLPTADWFDVEHNPNATFLATGMTRVESGSYSMDGMLTLRGISKPVSVTFTLSDPAVQPVTAMGSLVIDRLAYGIGEKSDPRAEWVSREIPVTLKVVANKR